MLSELFELAGFAGLTYATYGLAGKWWAIVAGSLFLLFIGAATDDAAVAGAVRRVGLSPVRLSRRAKWALARRKARRAREASSSSPHPPPIDFAALDAFHPGHSEASEKREFVISAEANGGG